MKKILSIFLAALLIASLAACGSKPEEKPAVSDEVIDEQKENIEVEEKAEDEAEDVTDEETAPETKPETKPSQSKPAESKPAENKPAESKPEAKPEATPEVQPETEKAPDTLGNTLLADFKVKANSGMSTLEIAEGLVQNEAILFSGGAMEVEPGLLSGFDNTEITGFKSGAVFMPMIGSIAFVGYVFELEDAASVPAFISTLKSSANMRWNICVEAEEMVTGSVGNKVFFVMCPKTLEE